MKLKSISAENIEIELLRVIPNADVVIRDGQLHSLKIDDVHIVVGSYSIQVAKETYDKKWEATASMGDHVIRFEDKTEEALREKVQKICIDTNFSIDKFTFAEVDDKS